MLIGVISDVHDNLRHLAMAVRFFNDKKIDLLINCGDFDMPFTMRGFVPLSCPIKSVLGNGDPDIQKFLYQLQNLEVLKKVDMQINFRFMDLKIDGNRIGIFHGDDDDLVNFLTETQMLDVLCIGHTHRPEIKQVGKTLVINPGSLVGYMQETGNQPITVALYDTKTKKGEIVDLEKTGL